MRGSHSIVVRLDQSRLSMNNGKGYRDIKPRNNIHLEDGYLKPP